MTAIPQDATLAQLEAVVERGLDTFVEVGLALAAIRDRGLHRDTHSTFDVYCRERFGMDRTYAHRHIAAAEVVAVLPNGNGPANEAQARELAPMLRDEGEQAVVEVYRELREQHGERLTAKVVRQTVQRRLRAQERSEQRSERRAAQRADTAPLPPSVGSVVAYRPTLTAGQVRLRAELEGALDAERAAREAVRRLRGELSDVTDRGPWGLLWQSPGSQLVTEHGDVYVGDGEVVRYVGRVRPERPGWSTWGHEAAPVATADPNVGDRA